MDPHTSFSPRTVPGRPPPMMAPPLRPAKKRMSGTLIAAICGGAVVLVVGISALGLVLLSALGRAGSSTTSSAPSVDVSACSAVGGVYRATVTVKNNRSRAANISVTVEWVTEGSGTRLALDVEYFSDLAAGQEAVSEAMSTGPVPQGGVNCEARIR